MKALSACPLVFPSIMVLRLHRKFNILKIPLKIKNILCGTLEGSFLPRIIKLGETGMVINFAAIVVSQRLSNNTFSLSVVMAKNSGKLCTMY